MFRPHIDQLWGAMTMRLTAGVGTVSNPTNQGPANRPCSSGGGSLRTISAKTGTTPR